MKNYFKKFSIMFVMSLVIILGNSKCAFANDIHTDNYMYYQNETIKVTYNIPFCFLGKSAWIAIVPDRATSLPDYRTVYHISNLEGEVELSVPEDAGIYRVLIYPGKYDNGRDTYIPSDNTIEVSSQHLDISLNKSTDNLSVGETDNLVATTTPGALKVEWKSSDESVATVDSNGKVTALKEGQATISAKVARHEKETSCVINVTDSISLEMPDGNKYKVTNSQVQDFIQWYKDRENNKSNSTTYKFNSSDAK